MSPGSGQGEAWRHRRSPSLTIAHRHHHRRSRPGQAAYLAPTKAIGGALLGLRGRRLPAALRRRVPLWRQRQGQRERRWRCRTSASRPTCASRWKQPRSRRSVSPPDGGGSCRVQRRRWNASGGWRVRGRDADLRGGAEASGKSGVRVKGRAGRRGKGVCRPVEAASGGALPRRQLWVQMWLVGDLRRREVHHRVEPLVEGIDLGLSQKSR